MVITLVGSGRRVRVTFYTKKYGFLHLSCLILTDAWYKCDDDKVSPVTEEEVLKLSGGGDWHCAYVLLYGPQQIEKLE